MQIKYYGHACFEIIIGGKKLLFDPFITGNSLAKNIDISNIMPDYIFISHAHQDHVGDTIAIAKQSGALVISNFEITNKIQEWGINNVHAMNIGGKYEFDFGTAKYVYALHSSSFSDGSYGGNAGGFIIQSKEGNFYFAGDTGLSTEMKLIGDYRTVDFALLPIGGNFTMDVDNAIIAANMIRCNIIFGMHYNTFPVIKIDKKLALEKFDRAGKNLHLLDIGETYNYSN
jgi:L-ascorbate metabolism protein UlaG (beta-lactamase superfamily)